VVNQIIRRFPRATTVENGIFRLFAESECRHGARSIASVIELIRLPKSERHISVNDITSISEHDLQLHVSNMPRKWDRDTAQVMVSI
jgi:hypothetical protein